jgi:hypothetical protein
VVEGMNYVFIDNNKNIALKQYEVYASDANGTIGERKDTLDFSSSQTLHWAASYNAAGNGWYLMRPIKNSYGYGPVEDVNPTALYNWV